MRTGLINENVEMREGEKKPNCVRLHQWVICSFYVLLTEQHFTEVVGSEEFLNLGMEQVSSLISSDKLTIPTEEKVHSHSAQYEAPEWTKSKCVVLKVSACFRFLKQW